MPHPLVDYLEGTPPGDKAKAPLGRLATGETAWGHSRRLARASTLALLNDLPAAYPPADEKKQREEANGRVNSHSPAEQRKDYQANEQQGTQP